MLLGGGGQEEASRVADRVGQGILVWRGWLDGGSVQGSGKLSEYQAVIQASGLLRHPAQPDCHPPVLPPPEPSRALRNYSPTGLAGNI